MTNASDVVDTEPSNGDVYKMLLGSISKLYDERDDSEPTTPSSGPSTSSEETAQASSSPALPPGIQRPLILQTSDLFSPPGRSDTDASSSTLRANIHNRQSNVESILKKQ